MILRLSTAFFQTLREAPADAEATSHRLMLRAGLIRQVAGGLYTYLPLGWRIIQKIEAIVREEMDRSGAQEILAPILQPAQLWEETGRIRAYGPELMRLEDRHGRAFVLGPTHEELFTDLVRGVIRSYRQLPITLYQIQDKFRDERRPRFGLLRGREFIMKDAYSFDCDEEGMAASYEAMYQAYVRIFARLGLDTRAVEAQQGAIGGTGGSHEFMAIAPIGEDEIVYCDACDYAANVEKAQGVPSPLPAASSRAETVGQVSLPGVIETGAQAEALGVDRAYVLKTLLYEADGQPIAAILRGDHTLNEAKLAAALGVAEVTPLSEERVRKLLPKATHGYIGPLGLSEQGVGLFVEPDVMALPYAICGSNEEGFLRCGLRPHQAFADARILDLKEVYAGDPCPSCGAPLAAAHGIEVGQVFKLGTKYSAPMGAVYLDEAGQQRPLYMGCYGIGVSRIAAAVVEQSHDEDGIVWPMAVAPAHVHVVIVDMQNEEQRVMGEHLAETLSASGYEVIIDDRQEHAGVKFKDADLLGIPLRMTVGRKAGEGIVELSRRRDRKTVELKVEEIVGIVARLLGENS